MTRIAEIADRLHRLAKRREDEGIYTDAALCEEAAAYLTAALAAEPGEAVAADAELLKARAARDEYREIAHDRTKAWTAAEALAHPHPLPLKEEVERVLEPFAEAWNVATHHKDLVAKLTMAQLGELAAHEVSGIHFRNADALLSRIRAGAQEGWRSMDSAPKDGKHCILCVPEPWGIFYSVQGAFQDGQWNAVHRENVEPVAWMPNIRLPAHLRPAAPSPAKEGGR